MRMLAVDLGFGAVGTAAGFSVSDYTGLCTAASAGFYLACKGVVLVIRELKKK